MQIDIKGIEGPCVMLCGRETSKMDFCLFPDDLRGLVQACGATSVSSPNMFSFNPRFTQLILVQHSEDERSASQMKGITSTY